MKSSYLCVNRSTAVHYAAYSGHTKVVHWLAKVRCLLDFFSSSATFNSKYLYYIFKRGANIFLENEDGYAQI